MDTFPRPFGPYVLLAHAGGGGMGRVFFAVEDRRPERLLVLKQMMPDLRRDPRMVARFRDEGEITRRLNHPNIVKTEAVGEHEGEPFIAQEFVWGHSAESYREHCKNDGLVIPESVVLHLAREVAKALEYAHDFEGLDVVHRDLTPVNVQISYDGGAKLLDFGLAKWRKKLVDTSTGDGMLGKPFYMPPEQLRTKTTDRRGDLYTLGVCMWEFLTGRPMGTFLQDGKPTLPKQDAADYIQRILEDVPLPPSTFRKGLAPEVDALVGRLLKKDPSERYQTAGLLLKDLERIGGASLATGRAALARQMMLFPQKLEAEHHAELRELARRYFAELAPVQATPPEPEPAPRELASRAPATAHPSVRPLEPEVARVAEALPRPGIVEERPWKQDIAPSVHADRRASMKAGRADRTSPTLQTLRVPRTAAVRFAALGLGAAAVLILGYFLLHDTTLSSSRAGSAVTAGEGPATPRTAAVAPSPKAAPSEPVAAPRGQERPALEAPPSEATQNPPQSVEVSPRAAASARRPKMLQHKSPRSDDAPQAPMRAETHVAELPMFDSKALDATMQRATTAYLNGNLDLALAEGKRAVAQGGGGAAHSLLGSVYAKRELYDDAAREYGEALRANPNDKVSEDRLRWLRSKGVR